MNVKRRPAAAPAEEDGHIGIDDGAKEAGRKRDPAAIADRVAYLAENPGLRKEMGETAGHKRYIDYLRVMSMLSVVMIHVCATALDDGKGTMGGVLFASVRNMLNFAVPVFLMITGALMLDPGKDIPLRKLLKKYILKYACVIAVFGWVYSLLELVFTHRGLHWGYFLRSFADMLQGRTWAHMWYMYSLLGVMLVLPILRWTSKSAGRKEAIYLIAVLGLCNSILPFIGSSVGFHIELSTPITSWLFLYLMFGYWIDREFIRISSPLCALVMLCSVIAQCAAGYFQVMRGVDMDFISAYSSPLIVVYSVAVFALFRNMGGVQTAGAEGEACGGPALNSGEGQWMRCRACRSGYTSSICSG